MRKRQEVQEVLRAIVIWMAILSGRVQASPAVTGGVHTALDVVKATMAGAHVTQMVSALLMHGPAHLRMVLDDLAVWMAEHEWHSLAEMRGNMSLFKVADPDTYERASYAAWIRGDGVTSGTLGFVLVEEGSWWTSYSRNANRYSGWPGGMA